VLSSGAEPHIPTHSYTQRARKRAFSHEVCVPTPCTYAHT
jgi:hypothetical protein